ncbi:MAG TPA: phenylalanine--tRNA ligase subunit alpha [Thermoanaerobaculia bacterium]|nr:phenylalanine--tRNA ligase subunit alpha [Thermoanaerobaculia bacterium]
MTIFDTIDKLETEALASLRSATGSAGLEEWRVANLGRKSRLTEALRGLREVPPEERPAAGQRVNEARARLEEAFEARREEVRRSEAEAEFRAGTVDVTLPGRRRRLGRVHVSVQTLRRIYRIWAEMGFQVYRSRDVETDELNFQLLNFPPHHPARDMQDTFHTTRPDVLLRTHTSAGQIHSMRAFHPEPIRVVLPGMCYRYEQVSARSETQFHQVEGLAVGPNIHMTDLKGTLSDFARRMFGAGTRTRFRCSYFPFTEPSAEMDVECFLCGGDGCSVCKQAGWLEILGCGMVHPNVLANGGYDPAEVSGFAFGMGPERIAMLMHGIDDVRQFWSSDLRLLEQL